MSVDIRLQAKSLAHINAVIGSPRKATPEEIVSDSPQLIIGNPDYPPKPDFLPLNEEQRKKHFGVFAYKVLPNGDIKIIDNWVAENIIKVPIPQLAPIYKPAAVYFHKKYADRLKELFVNLEKQDLMKYMLTWDGAFYPRLVRGSATVLSNHSWATAFDCNVKWNQMKQVPALFPDEGCVRAIAETANSLGWFWGGHFKRKDGMHFEIAEV